MNSSGSYIMYIKKANDDFEVANTLLSQIKPKVDIICFHFQQFVEKYLKAYLVFKGIEPFKTHRIAYLLKECIKVDTEFDKFSESDIIELTDCAVMVRYEGTEEIDIEFIKELLPVLNDFKIFLEIKINYTIQDF